MQLVHQQLGGGHVEPALLQRPPARNAHAGELSSPGDVLRGGGSPTCPSAGCIPSMPITPSPQRLPHAADVRCQQSLHMQRMGWAIHREIFSLRGRTLTAVPTPNPPVPTLSLWPCMPSCMSRQLSLSVFSGQVTHSRIASLQAPRDAKEGWKYPAARKTGSLKWSKFGNIVDRRVVALHYQWRGASARAKGQVRWREGGDGRDTCTSEAQHAQAAESARIYSL